MKNKIQCWAAAAMAVAGIMITSCTGDGKFTVEGNMAGADKSTLMLQTAIHGRWITIDSVKTDDSGKFKYSRQAPEYPEIYRLVSGKNVVYFPIDSLDNVKVESQSEGGVFSYSLSGAPSAEAMTMADRTVAQYVGASAEKRAELKRELSKQIVANPSGIVAYYIINKQAGGAPVFDATDAADVKIFGAVANAYLEMAPSNPRTPLIVSTYMQNRRVNPASTAARDTLYANEARIIEVKLPDEKGNSQSLTDVTSHGKVVVLNFVVYSADDAPAFNKSLSDIYNKYKGEGLEIFQVALDSDIAAWKLAAQNLPWITVYDESGINSRNVRSYNVGVVPLSFVVSRQGEVVSRVVDHSKLESEIKKQL